MEGFILEWLNLLGRWVHIITGIAWIGASFYFVFLDRSLEPPKKAEDAEKGVSGEIWSVHGGGFYHAQKYQLAPAELPKTLHWFKWEAYSTWLSGMFLFGLIYWYGAELYLIDSSVMALSQASAILISIGFIVGGWIFYDLLCKSALGKKENLLAFIMLIFVSVAAYALCQIYSGRGAYIMFGAMLGTIMVGNVFFVIIPGQKDLVKAKVEGREPDPIHGIRGKQRSVHNTFFTLPVLFVMISNHYAMTFGNEYNWLILIAISVSGAMIRVFFVSRLGGGKPATGILMGGIAILIITSGAMAFASFSGAESTAVKVDNAKIESIIEQRCSVCHSSQPTQPGFIVAPKGVIYDNMAQI
ncbi:MAG: putative membrane protein, partial [Gammaproteobacteria bacterium]